MRREQAEGHKTDDHGKKCERDEQRHKFTRIPSSLLEWVTIRHGGQRRDYFRFTARRDLRFNRRGRRVAFRGWGRGDPGEEKRRTERPEDFREAQKKFHNIDSKMQQVGYLDSGKASLAHLTYGIQKFEIAKGVLQ